MPPGTSRELAVDARLGVFKRSGSGECVFVCVSVYVCVYVFGMGVVTSQQTKSHGDISRSLVVDISLIGVSTSAAGL